MHYHYLTLEQRNSLEKIMAGRPEAERKALHAPEYGVCERCGGDIAFVRLLDNPLTRQCRACET